MIDYTRLRDKLNPTSQIGGVDELRLRVGVVAALNSNGTVELTISETTVSSVPVLNGVPLFVGSVVQLLAYRGTMLILGTVAEAADEDSSVSFSTTAIQPLTNSTATDVSIMTLSHAFKAGYAYQIDWQWSAQIGGGASPYLVQSKLKRLNASGTLIEDMGGTPIIGTNFGRMAGSAVVKCTSANTTQTICLTGAMSTSGAPTSLDVEAASTRRTMLRIRRIGTATKYTGALEVPTA